jgi:phage gpG-like protein
MAVTRSGIKKIGKGFDFAKKKIELIRNKRQIARIVANEALNHFLVGFRKGGGQTDAGMWRKRKLRVRDFTSKSPKVRARARKQVGRAILVDTGALRRDIGVRSISSRKVSIGTTRIPYARRHNEGLKGMPKREFLGDSKKLDKKVNKLILKELNKILG